MTELRWKEIPWTEYVESNGYTEGTNMTRRVLQFRNAPDEDWQEVPFVDMWGE